MSYNKALFHRMAGELERIANEAEGKFERMDESDFASILGSMVRIMSVMDYEEHNIAFSGLGIASLEFNGTADELEDEKWYMVVMLLDEFGYERMSSDTHDAWVN